MTSAKIKNIFIEDIIRDFHVDIISILGSNHNYFNTFSSIQQPKPHSLIWANSQNLSAVEDIVTHPYSCVIITDTPPDCIVPETATVIIVKKSKLFFIDLLNTYFARKQKTGIHPTAIVNENARIGENVHIGPHCVIGNCSIGDNCVFEGNNYVYDNVLIGRNVTAQPGTILGSSCMAFVRKEDLTLIKFNSFGNLLIEDFVEFGTNVIVDISVLESTIIKKGTKINNNCSIGNSVIIGTNNYIAAGVNINGSVHIGNNNFIGSGSTIRNKISIGSNNTIGAGAVVVKHIADNGTWIGNPAQQTNKSKGVQL